MKQHTDAFRNGRHCGFLISRVPCPYNLGTKEAEDWEQGFVVGREALKEEFLEWKKSQP